MDGNQVAVTQEAADAITGYENQIRSYIEETGNHVLLQKSGYSKGSPVGAVYDGIQFEAYSTEDDGEGISFNVYIYNASPDIGINYFFGDSWEAPESDSYLIDQAGQFHLPDCSYAGNQAEERAASREELIREGYTWCKDCKS